MAIEEVKITEKEVADLLKDEAHVLVTQPETVNEQETEALRRMPLEKFSDYLLGGLPIRINPEDGYADFTGLRQITDISVVKLDDYTICLTARLEGNEIIESYITLDGLGYPTKIVTNGFECFIGWSGFD